MDCLHTLFRRQAQTTPHATAVVGDDCSLTFQELDQRSDRLAAVLQHHGVGVDDTVGLYMEKSAAYVVGCLAALKAGGAFLPLFLDTPPSQLSKILDQTHTKAVLTTRRLAPNLPPSSLKPAVVEADRPDSWPRTKLRVVEHRPENLMFVVYTSGTTGEPKGIALPHRAAVHSYQERHKFQPYRPGQQVGCNIFFVWEIFRPLIRGATVHVISDDIIYDPKPLARFLSERNITEVLFTPSLMETLLNHLPRSAWSEQLSQLEVIWLNGEVVTEELRAKALAALPSEVSLLNTYSISECHDVANHNLRTAETSPTGFCRVGCPIPGISVHLLSDEQREVEAGNSGEIFVGGPGLARGYLGRPHLTAQRFVEIGGERLYRTGDFGVMYPDGLLEIRGRCDSMVKIRGYSVHLGAVQSALEKLESVKAAAVVAVGKEGRDKRLVAYVVGCPKKAWKVDSCCASSPQLRELLRDSLPEFMLPNLFVELEALPLNPTTGKLDSKALPPVPERKDANLDDLSLPPEANLEQKRQLMCIMWERLLGLDPGVVEPDSNFFDLGGHSLMAVRVVQHSERIYGASITVKQLYENPTVKQLTNLIDSGQTHQEAVNIPASEWQLEPSLTYQRKPPVALPRAQAVLVTGATGFLGAFILDAVQSRCDCPIYVLVRSGEKPVQQRLEENLRSYGLEPGPQLRALAGDLSKPNLGLTPDDYEKLAGDVDLVFHSGAAVNYVHSYSILKPHTVDGTREILKLCGEKRSKSLHYISTNGIFGGSDRYLENNEIDSYLPHLENGYGQSKWVAEKLVWEAVARGLNATIYRPGNIGHHSQTGAANPNDFQVLLIRGCLKLKEAPLNENWFLEMTPVDGLAQAVATFASHPGDSVRVFNVVQSPTTRAMDFWNYLLEQKKVDQFVSMEQWIERAHQVARETHDSKLEVLANSLSDVEGYLTDKSVYDGSRFKEALQAHSLTLPEANVSYLEKLIAPPIVASSPK